jgi:hypothetical protein
MPDHAPESSAAVRWQLLRKVSDPLARIIDTYAEVSTTITADRRARTDVQIRHANSGTSPLVHVDERDDADACAALRSLPGADPSVAVGSPGRTYTVTWDGIRAPV